VEQDTDTIEFRVFMPDPSCPWKCDHDDAGMPMADWEVLVNGEALWRFEPLNWEHMVESSARSGLYHLVTCACGWPDCLMCPPYRIRHADGFIHCRIDWDDYGHPEKNRSYCWRKSDYVSAVAEALRSAQRILTTRPLTDEESRDYPGAAQDRMTNLGHADFTLVSFNECLARFRALHGPDAV
jgi:hypothetical protein